MATNGFYRRFAGSLAAAAAKLAVRCVDDNEGGSVSLYVTNAGAATVTVTVVDQYTGATSHQDVVPGATFRSDWSLQTSYRWYDLLVQAAGDNAYICQCAGHVETGVHSVSDPLL